MSVNLIYIYIYVYIYIYILYIYICLHICNSVKFTSQLFRSAEESLKDETRMLLLWDCSLVTLQTLCSYLYHLRWSQRTSLWGGTEFLKAVYWLSSISIVLCIFILFRYIFWAFTTSSVLAIRRTSLLGVHLSVVQ